jgi:hypothetical protein
VSDQPQTGRPQTGEPDPEKRAAALAAIRRLSWRFPRGYRFDREAAQRGSRDD